MITRKNYELFFIEYLDGKLSTDKAEKLTLFLKQNPDLAFELETVSSIKLKANNCDTIRKEDLYRLPDFENNTISEQNAEMFSIAEFENDLSANSSKKWKDWKKSTSDKNLRFDFSKTVLKPDKSIVFKHKSTLYKKRHLKFKSWLTGVAAIAAVLAIFYGIFKNQIPNFSQFKKQDIADNIKISQIVVDNPIITDLSEITDAKNEQTTINMFKDSNPNSEHVSKSPLYSDIKSQKSNEKSIVITSETQNDNQNDNKRSEYQYLEKIKKRDIFIELAQFYHKEIIKTEQDNYVFYTSFEFSDENEGYGKIRVNDVFRIIGKNPLKKASIIVAQRLVNRINDKSKNIQIELFFDEENKFEYFAMQTSLFEIERIRK